MSEYFGRTLARRINLVVALAIAVFSLLISIAVYYDMERLHEKSLVDNISLANNVFDAKLESEKKSLLQTLAAIKNDTKIIKALKSGDRQQEINASKELFDELKEKFAITHFYFIGTDAICQLRVHAPSSYGDTIKRMTFQKAQMTGKAFVDLEMGMHFFSMRAVTPVFEGATLLGYIEIGREIDDIFETFKKQTGFEISLLLEDDYVKQYEKSSNTILTPKGEKVRGHVILNSSDAKFAAKILNIINADKINMFKTDHVDIDNKVYFSFAKEIKDAFGNVAGDIFISVDHTQTHKSAQKQYGLILAMAIMFIALLALFIRYGVHKEILVPLERIKIGVTGFFDYIRGEKDHADPIRNMPKNEIGAIADTLNESIEETMQILNDKKNNEAFFLQQSRVMALGEMISNIAHQWRQPLNSIAILAQDIDVARQYGELDEKYLKDSMDQIFNVTKELSGTIDNLRSFYKPQTDLVDFFIDTEVGEVVRFFQSSLADSGIKITNEVTHHHKMHGHANEFSQVLMHLLRNCKDVLQDREIKEPQINIHDEEVEQNGVVFAKITITDNAGGASDESMERIFDPYFTTKHKAQGVGLGLYLSKMIIEKSMGGTLSAKNAETGLEVSILLPLV
jgi:signal transduction histidine kinase